ncbi:hypothetical protein FRB97_008352 [Tulasnella sp. 331]|nr:hypothetical protein FRB97_008352 [Tulasnella sp. 331]
MSDISKFKSSLFGSRRDFWSKYDAFAVTYNRDMMEYLNTNLDVMLIFAGLFSAINTAFIVVALNALSANPADETNHLLRLLVMNVSNSTLTESDLTPPLAPTTSAVRQNCTFFASLCCSLLAAAGAVLAKQWMQFNGRTGQKGPFEQQAIWRTKKFVGAEKWKLGAVVETLATLLLMSLALCFIALVDYLWTVEETVTIVVMAFAASGAYLYITMVVVAAIISACPFQTGPSAALQRLRPTLERAPELRDLVFNKGWELLSAPFTTSSLNSNIGRLLDLRDLADLSDPVRLVLTNGEGELVETLHRLLLTSAPSRNEDQTNMEVTAQLALRASTAMEKEQLLQGVLYSLLLDIQGDSNPLEAQDDAHAELEKRREGLREGPIVGLILTSTLRLLLWLYPMISSDQAWTLFDRYLRVMAFGDLVLSEAPVSECRIELWDRVMEIAREGPPDGYRSMGPSTLCLASRVVDFAELDMDREAEWFGPFMEGLYSDSLDTDRDIPVETRTQWGVINRKCAGILFLEAWQVDSAASTVSRLSKWTSPSTIDAFATWLRIYNSSETVEIKLKDVVLMQISVDPGLVTRFIDRPRESSRC